MVSSSLRLAEARFLLKDRADWSLAARLDEHRLSKNTMGLVRAFGEQERPTALVALQLSVVELEARNERQRIGHPHSS